MMVTLSGSEHEVDFWRMFVLSERFQKGWIPETRTPDLGDCVHDFLIKTNPRHVLDVGSGVVSLLRGTIAAPRLVMVDPLAEVYKTFFDYAAHGINPPFAFPAEELNTAVLGTFDVVHCSNALDHTQDPLLALARMSERVSPHGHLIIQGFVNEADWMQRAGMHQHNLTVDTGLMDLLVDGLVFPARRLNLKPVLCTMEKHGERDWMVWIAQKTYEYDAELARL